MTGAGGRTPVEPGDVLSADEVVAMIADQNDRDDPWEGPVPAHVLRYGSYLCASFPIAGCDLYGHGYDPGLAEEYSHTSADRFPPVVIDPEDGSVIDGYHRIHAAMLRGETDVLSLVGIPGTIDLEWIHP